MGPCAGCADRGTDWAWQDMQMDVSWGFERPGIGPIRLTNPDLVLH